MSITTVTTRIDRKWLERKTKWELAGIIMNNIDKIDLFAEEPRPTQWAYDQACAAIKKHRAAAAEANAKVSELEAELAEAREAFGHSESERCELRAALRDTIEALGGVAAPGVSIQFLKLAPKEAAAVKKQLAEAREDSKRMDYLEGEMAYEQRCIEHGQLIPSSLFRRNVPITRAAVDTARVKP